MKPSYLYLQPLRVASGWTISWNSFPAEDPTEENLVNFSGTLLAAYNNGAHIAIDMEFYPDNLEDGKFHISFIQYQKKGRKIEDIGLIGKYESRNRQEAIAALEEFMFLGTVKES